jgi:DNA-binding response OmpR family regulator
LTLDSARNPDKPGENELVGLLRRQGINATFVSSESDVRAGGDSDGSPSDQLALVDTTYLTSAEVKRCVSACSEANIPVVALVSRNRIADLDPSLPITDFISSPPDPDELVIRAQFALREDQDDAVSDDELIRMGDLIIDTSSYEVTLSGERIGLRFKEYELLRLLAENPGRVFTRDALLNQVWGYEYFGGARTVDVHIRRLRSKIEDSDHSYIETIWNVGYRFNES